MTKFYKFQFKAIFIVSIRGL